MSWGQKAYLDAQCVRQEIQIRGGDKGAVSAAEIAAVLKVVGHDCDLAATAIVMFPRPAWVAELIPGDRGIFQHETPA